MRLHRLRLRLRTLLIAVAVAAVGVGAVILARRQAAYAQQSAFHAQQEQVAASRKQHWAPEVARLSNLRGGRDSLRADEDRIAAVMTLSSRRRIAYHSSLKAKYARAARCPWLSVPPDPPSPDGTRWSAGGLRGWGAILAASAARGRGRRGGALRVRSLASLGIERTQNHARDHEHHPDLGEGGGPHHPGIPALGRLSTHADVVGG